MGLRLLGALGACGVLLAIVAPAAFPAGAKTTRVSVSSHGAQGDSLSGGQFGHPGQSISADGRFVAFESFASNLVSGDTHDQDVFVHDRRTGKTRLVSVSSSGAQAQGSSSNPSVSANGRFVAFESYAGNLVSGDTNRDQDIFVRDRRTGKTTRVAVSSSGAQAQGDSYAPSVSADGRFVAFESDARNLVHGDNKGSNDVFVHDRRTGKTRRVSVSSSGAQAHGSSGNPAISANGRFVTFESLATNLVRGDTNHSWDVFVHDRRTGKTRRVSVSSSGAQAHGSSSNPSISAGGRFVAFVSWAPKLAAGDKNGFVDVFVRDRRKGKTRLMSVSSAGAQGNDRSRSHPSISAGGRYVAFESSASNLVRGDSNRDQDIFVRDRRTGMTARVSLSSSGAQADDDSFGPSISAGGRFVAFQSFARTLVSGDTNEYGDVFVRGPLR
jgi:Tol biopolymer transport system component